MGHAQLSKPHTITPGSVPQLPEVTTARSGSSGTATPHLQRNDSWLSLPGICGYTVWIVRESGSGPQRPHQFPQFSTAQNADRVTNNLDRGFARAKTGRMYDGSPRRTTAIASATVSLKTDLLFRNTLGANTCGSIFYLSRAADRIRNSMRIKTFGIAQGKVVEANPLFCNVLPASLSGSIFYGSSGDERATNSFKMNILETSAKKLWRVPERRSKQKGRP